MSEMKAAVYEKYGEPAKVLTMKKVPIPEPKSGEIRVKMKRSPIHNHDILMVRGEYGSLQDLPAIGGTEAVGIIDAIGDNVDNLEVGMRVAVAGTNNTWAEYFIAAANAALAIPDGISDEAAAQLTAMPSSSLMALNKIPAKPGDWIVVNAANGAVGKSVAQLAQARGIKVASIVNRDEAKKKLEDLGISPVFVAAHEGWLDEAKKTIDGYVAGGIEMVGGSSSNDLIKLVGEGGTVLAFGAMSNKPMQIDAGQLIYRDISIKGFWGLRESQKTSPEDMAKIMGELIEFVQAGKLKLTVHKTYDIEHVAEAGKEYYEPRSGKLMIAG